MAKRKQEDPPAGAPAWMGTYSDLVTLLFCFFVLLYAMSNIDEAKLAAFANSFAGRPVSVIDIGGSDALLDLMGNGILEMPTPSNEVNEKMQQYKQMQEEFEKMASEFKTYFAESEFAEQIQVDIGDQIINIIFSEGVMFDSGKADLKPQAFPILNALGQKILEYPNSLVVVEGHTDNVPISTIRFPSNWDLSAARATSVANFFTETVGIDTLRIDRSYYADTKPIDTNSTAEGRAKNRRVEIAITSEFYSSEE